MNETTVTTAMNESLMYEGAEYVSTVRAAEIMGVKRNTMLTWSQHPDFQAIKVRYLGRVYFNKKALEQMKESLIKKCG